MLLQLLKLQGYSPIVAVVGSRHKADACRRLGADFVIDKSSVDLWAEVRKISKEYIAIFDANGVETLQQSFNHLARCGHLVTYGFHSNLPKNSSYLSPLTWIRMIVDLVRMPRFDSMQLVLESKSVSGFNLSFFAEEHALIATYMTTLTQWVESGALKFPDTAVMEMKNIRSAHELIQSGASIGKIVMRASGW